MKTTIDSAGRIVIPREIRRSAALRAGEAVEVRYEAGAIVIEPAATPMRVERRGRFAVLVPAAPMPSLDAEVVAETLRRVREERGG